MAERIPKTVEDLYATTSATEKIPAYQNGAFNRMISVADLGGGGASLPWVTPEQYGAVGDGTTDDTAAIQDALDSGSDVRLDGVYVSDSLVITNADNITITGNGTITQKSGSADGADLITFSGTCSNITIDGLTLIGLGDADYINYPPQYSRTAIGAPSGQTLSGITVRNCRISNFNVGISFNSESGGSCTDFLAENNIITDIKGTQGGSGYGIHVATASTTVDGIKVPYPAHGIIRGNIIKRCERHAIYIAITDDVLVTGNIISDHRTTCGVANETTNPMGNGVYRAAISVARSSNVTVSDNKLTNINDGGIHVSRSEANYLSNHTVVTGNTLNGWAYGASITLGYSDPTVSAPNDVVLSGNTFNPTIGTDQPCVYVYGVNSALIHGNTFGSYADTSRTWYGVLFSGMQAVATDPIITDDIMVSDNHFINAYGGCYISESIRNGYADTTSYPRITWTGNEYPGCLFTLAISGEGTTNSYVVNPNLSYRDHRILGGTYTTPNTITGQTGVTPRTIGQTLVTTYGGVRTWVSTGTTKFSWMQTGGVLHVGDTAPSLVPEYVGQRYTDTTAGITYEATGTTSSADWKKSTGFTHTDVGADAYHGIEAAGALSFDDTTHILTMASGTTTYWYQGTRYTTANAITCDLDSYATLTSNTLYYVFFEDATGTLKASASAWNLKTKVPVAAIFWNGSAGIVYQETHNHTRDLDWHTNAHMTIGARYGSGLGLTLPTTTTDGSLQIESGTIYDEDLIATITQQTTCRVVYLASAGVYTFVNSSLPYAGTTGQPQYLDTDTYALTNVGASDYAPMWVYATADTARPIHIIPHAGAAAFNTLALARAATPPDLAGLNLSPEYKLIYRFIFKGDGQFQESADYRQTSSLPAGGTATVTASSVVFTPSGTIAATNVQAAIEEVATESATVYSTTTPLVAGTATAGDEAAASRGNHVHPRCSGYSLFFMCANSSLAASTTYRLAGYFQAINTDAQNNYVRVYIPKSGTVKAAYGTLKIAGTTAATGTITLNIIKNDSTTAEVTNTLAANSINNTFGNGSLSLDVSAGDYLNIQVVAGSLSATITSAQFAITLYIEA